MLTGMMLGGNKQFTANTAARKMRCHRNGRQARLVRSGAESNNTRGGDDVWSCTATSTICAGLRMAWRMARRDI